MALYETNIINTVANKRNESMKESMVKGNLK